MNPLSSSRFKTGQGVRSAQSDVDIVLCAIMRVYNHTASGLALTNARRLCGCSFNVWFGH